MRDYEHGRTRAATTHEPPQRRRFKEIITSVIMATDMAQHGKILNAFEERTAAGAYDAGTDDMCVVFVHRQCIPHFHTKFRTPDKAKKTEFCFFKWSSSVLTSQMWQGRSRWPVSCVHQELVMWVGKSSTCGLAGQM